MRDIICIGASTGGLDALIRLVKGLPATLPAAIFVVRHIAAGGDELLPAILTPHTALPVATAVDGDEIKPGRILIAPGDYHLLLQRKTIVLSKGPKENWVRPAIDPLFRTAAQFHGPRTIGIVLSGKLDDGTAGLWALKRRGGFVVVQNPRDAIAGEMPRSAMAATPVDVCADAEEIGQLLASWCRQDTGLVSDDSLLAALEAENAYLFETQFGTDKLQAIGDPWPVTCPDCGGQLWRIKEGPMRFRCHVGHGASVATLRAQQRDVIEVSGWRFIRAMEEETFLLEGLIEIESDPATKQALVAELEATRKTAKQVREVVEREKALGPDSIHPDSAATQSI